MPISPAIPPSARMATPSSDTLSAARTRAAPSRRSVPRLRAQRVADQDAAAVHRVDADVGAAALSPGRPRRHPERLPQGPGQSQTDDEGEDGDRPAPGRRGRSDDSDEPRGGYGRGFELPQQGPIGGIPNRGGRAPMDAPRAPRRRRAPIVHGRHRPRRRRHRRRYPSRAGTAVGPGDSPYVWPLTVRRHFPDSAPRAGPKFDGQPLQRSVRDLLGGILGFSSRGVIGRIIRLIFVRFGWGILRRLSGRSLGGR